MNVYIVTAYHCSDHNSHSYIVGMFDTYHAALSCAALEESNQYGKYHCEIIEEPLDDPVVPIALLALLTLIIYSIGEIIAAIL